MYGERLWVLPSSDWRSEIGIAHIELISASGFAHGAETPFLIGLEPVSVFGLRE